MCCISALWASLIKLLWNYGDLMTHETRAFILIAHALCTNSSSKDGRNRRNEELDKKVQDSFSKKISIKNYK